MVSLTSLLFHLISFKHLTIPKVTNFSSNSNIGEFYQHRFFLSVICLWNTLPSSAISKDNGSICQDCLFACHKLQLFTCSFKLVAPYTVSFMCTCGDHFCTTLYSTAENVLTDRQIDSSSLFSCRLLVHRKIVEARFLLFHMFSDPVYNVFCMMCCMY